MANYLIFRHFNFLPPPSFTSYRLSFTLYSTNMPPKRGRKRASKAEVKPAKTEEISNVEDDDCCGDAVPAKKSRKDEKSGDDKPINLKVEHW